MTEKNDRKDDPGHLGAGVGPGDEDLSAFLDGELSREAEAALREKLTREPALAARLAELAEVTGQLRHLVEPTPLGESESELENQRVDRMHAALRSRLSVAEAEEALHSAPERPVPGEVIPLRPKLRWLAPAAAALAASLALYWGAGNFGPGGPGAAEDLAPESPGSPELLAERPPGPAPVEPLEAAVEAELALAPAAEEPGLEPLPVEQAVAAVDLAGADDEELAIAFDYDVLADLDVIQNLELLELLDELDGLEQI